MPPSVVKCRLPAIGEGSAKPKEDGLCFVSAVGLGGQLASAPQLALPAGAVAVRPSSSSDARRGSLSRSSFLGARSAVSWSVHAPVLASRRFRQYPGVPILVSGVDESEKTDSEKEEAPAPPPKKTFIPPPPAPSASSSAKKGSDPIAITVLEKISSATKTGVAAAEKAILASSGKKELPWQAGLTTVSGLWAKALPGVRKIFPENLKTISDDAAAFAVISVLVGTAHVVIASAVAFNGLSAPKTTPPPPAPKVAPKPATTVTKPTATNPPATTPAPTPAPAPAPPPAPAPEMFDPARASRMQERGKTAETFAKEYRELSEAVRKQVAETLTEEKLATDTFKDVAVSFIDSIVNVTVSDKWNKLPYEEQERIGSKLANKVKSLAFKEVDILDANKNVLGYYRSNEILFNLSKEYQTVIDKYLKDLKRLESEEGQLKGQLTQKDQQISTLQSDLDAKVKEIAAQRDAAAQAAAAKAEAEAAAADAKGQVSARDQQIADLTAKLQSTAAERDALASTAAGADDKLKSILAERDQLSASLSETKDKLGGTSEELKKASAQLSSLSAAQTKQADELAAAQKDKADVLAEKEKLAALVTKLQSDIAASADAVKGADVAAKNVETLSADLAAAKTADAQKASALAAADAKVKALQQEKDKIAAASAAVEKAKAALETDKKKLADQLSAQSAKLKELTAAAGSQKSAVTSLEQQVQKVSADRDKLADTVKTLTADKEAQKAAVVKSEAQIKALTADKDSLQQKIDLLEKQLKAVQAIPAPAAASAPQGRK